MTDFHLFSSALTPDRVVQLIRYRWLFLAKLTGIFGGLGVLYALLAPIEYTSDTRLMPEFQAGSAANFKQFGALADLVGIDLEGVSATEAVRPDLYPDVLTSTPFLLTVLNQPVTAADKKTYPSLVNFLTTAQPGLLTAWFNKAPLAMPGPDSPGHSVRLSKEQEDVLKDLRKRIVARLDPQSGLIDIQVKMPDAEVAAQVCQQATAYLRRYVVAYRTEKTRLDLRFIARRLAEAKARHNRTLNALSAYSDQNRFVFTQSARVAGKQLEADHELAQSLYNELSRQYEQTILKVQEETPVFSVLEPPKIPARRSEPRRMLTVLVGAAAGLGLGILWVLIKAIKPALDVHYELRTANG